MIFPSMPTTSPCYVCHRPAGQGVGFPMLFVEQPEQYEISLICERCIFRVLTGETRDYTPYMQQRRLTPRQPRKSWWSKVGLWLGIFLHG